MKIVFILILHLGLVACGNNATDASLTCNRCIALKEIKDYFFDSKENANGTRFTGMVNKYTKQGLIEYAEKDQLVAKIPENLALYGNLLSLATKAQTFIEDELCDCTGVPTKVCPKKDTNTSTIFDHLPGLNSSAGRVVVDEKDFVCANCEAIKRLNKYIKSPGDNLDGTKFWRLMDTITTDLGVLTQKETDRFKLVLTLLGACTARNYDRGAEHVIRYIHYLSPFRCCRYLGPTKVSCTARFTNLEKAILIIKDFINRNHQCPKELSTLVIIFYVEGSITPQRWSVYDKLIKDQLKDRPKKVAEIVLKDLKFNNGMEKLQDYVKKVNDDPKYDLPGTKILGLMKKFKDEGLITQGQYDKGLVSWKGKEIDGDQKKMAEYVKDKLVENHGY